MSADTTVVVFGYKTAPNAAGKTRMYRACIIQAIENLHDPKRAYDFARFYLDQPGQPIRRFTGAKAAAERLKQDPKQYVEYRKTAFYFVDDEKKTVTPMSRRTGKVIAAAELAEAA